MRQSYYSPTTSSNGKGADLGIKCPICMVAHTAVAPITTYSKHPNADRTRQESSGAAQNKIPPFELAPQHQCSHGCQLIFVSAECPICFETAESPVVAFPCGHVVCKSHFHALGGAIGDTNHHDSTTLLRRRNADIQPERTGVTRRYATLSEFLDANRARARQSTSAVSRNGSVIVNLNREFPVEEVVIQHSDSGNAFVSIDNGGDNFEGRTVIYEDRELDFSYPELPAPINDIEPRNQEPPGSLYDEWSQCSDSTSPSYQSPENDQVSVILEAEEETVPVTPCPTRRKFRLFGALRVPSRKIRQIG